MRFARAARMAPLPTLADNGTRCVHERSVPLTRPVPQLSKPASTPARLGVSAPASLPSPRDQQAFQRTIAPYNNALRAQALRLTKNRSEAEDLLQDTLLRAWRYWPNYREQDNCRAWLQRIMLNTFCSERRSHARKRRLIAGYALAQDAAAEAAAAEAAGAGEPHGLVSHEQVSHSLKALKPEHSRILRLVDMDERSYREAAAELACPVGTVMSRLHRARLALRTLLAAEALADQACA